MAVAAHILSAALEAYLRCVHRSVALRADDPFREIRVFSRRSDICLSLYPFLKRLVPLP